MEPGDAVLEGVPDGSSRDGDSVVSEGLERLLEAETSLTGSESKLIAAMLGLRTASLKQLSEVTGIRRSNIHGVADSLAAKGLCRRLGGRYSVWECPEPAEVLARLRAAEEQRLDAARSGLDRTFEEAERMLARPSSRTEDPSVTFIDETRIGVMYSDAMALVEGEVLVLNRGPYTGDLEPDEIVLDALARGVKARALYVSAELDAPDGELRLCADAYAAAGVEQRVLDSLPVSMAVLGQETALLPLSSPDVSYAMPSPSLAVRHSGLVKLLSAAFEHLWDHAEPYVADPARQGLRIVEQMTEHTSGSETS